MQRTKFIAGLVLALTVSVVAPSFATPGAEIPREEGFTVNMNSLGTSYIYNRDSGVVKKISATTDQLVQVASGWPTLPEGHTRNDQVRIRSTSTGDLVAGAFLEIESGSKSLWISVLGSSGWSSWVQMEQAEGFVNYFNMSDFAQSGSTLAFNYQATYGTGVKKTYIATNYGGTWHSVLIADSSVPGSDLLYPNNQITVPGQLSNEPVEYIYWTPNLNGFLPLALSGTKMALIGKAYFATESFQAQGNTFSTREQMFTQIIDLATMTPSRRTLIGDANPGYVGGYPTSDEGAVALYWERAWWNKSKTDIIVIATKNETTDCPAIPNGVDEWSFIRGSCHQRVTLLQFDQDAGVQLAQDSFLVGENYWLSFQTLETDAGLVAMLSTYRRSISVDGNGAMTGWLNDKSWTSAKWLTPNSSLKFSSISFTPVESTATAQSDSHWLFLHKGIAMDTNTRCENNGVNSDVNCTMYLNFFGEGKSQSFNTGYTQVSNDTIDGAIYVFPVGNKLALYKEEGTYNPDYVDTSTIRPNFYTPVVTKLNATLASVAATLKVKKSVNLPVVSKQKHPVTWTLAKSSKGICTLTLTKVDAVTTKAVVKGVKAGTCTLTAKTANGFFYKTLNKTVKISIKK